MKPAKKKKKKRKEKEKKKATTFLIFQDYKKITIISYKVIIVIPNTITHTQTELNTTDQVIIVIP